MFPAQKSHVDNVIQTCTVSSSKWERNQQSVDHDQTAPMRFNQGLHCLQISSTSTSFACIS